MQVMSGGIALLICNEEIISSEWIPIVWFTRFNPPASDPCRTLLAGPGSSHGEDCGGLRLLLLLLPVPRRWPGRNCS